jgi:regulator of RNase E activity RraA
MVNRAEKDLVDAFKKKATVADVSDALDEIADVKGPFVLEGVYPRTVKDYEVFPIVGTAITVQCLPQRYKRKLRFEKVTEAMKTAQQGDILVFGTGRANVLTVGQNMCMGFREYGIDAVVTDAGVRDVTETRRMGYPVFARTITPLSSLRGRLEFSEINVPIECGRVQVASGDIVIGDEDGVVVVPQDIASEVLKIAEKTRTYSVKIQEEILVKKTPFSEARIKVKKELGLL